ncbi:MAG: BspA family leucine-rich repeat surface protein [Clostridia bacterium]|nr:BspA family leucine-rich repeat surface protein [Clostridia bacterium]
MNCLFVKRRPSGEGFTIVELVIVIAVIAILAAVLIPTFSSIIQKANESKELQEGRNETLRQRIDDILGNNVGQAPGISFGVDRITLAVGTSEDLSAVVSKDNNTTVSWTSADGSVATVNSSGVVTGTGIGETSVTVSCVGEDAASASITVKVVDKTVLLQGTSFANKISGLSFSHLVLGWKEDHRAVADANDSLAVSVAASGSAEVYLSGETLYILSDSKMFANPDSAWMFKGNTLSPLKNVLSIKLENFDTREVLNMGSMFEECEKVETIEFGDSFYTANVTRMSNMFSGCKALASVSFGKKFSTGRVTAMTGMFRNCRALKALDLSGFDTSALSDEGIASSEYGAVTNMFFGCTALESLDLTGFDTSGIRFFYQTFYDCESLATLDISSFDTTLAENTYAMFYGCSALERITVVSGTGHWSMDNVTLDTSMFSGCVKLPGYDVTKTGRSKAVTTEGGYLTEKG